MLGLSPLSAVVDVVRRSPQVIHPLSIQPCIHKSIHTSINISFFRFTAGTTLSCRSYMCMLVYSGCVTCSMQCSAHWGMPSSIPCSMPCSIPYSIPCSMPCSIPYSIPCRAANSVTIECTIPCRIQYVIHRTMVPIDSQDTAGYDPLIAKTRQGMTH